MSTDARDDWLAIQASIAAERLVTVPTELLGPAGRTLQAAAASGTFAVRDLAAVPYARSAKSGPSTGKRPRSMRSGRHAETMQPPLMLGVDRPQD